MYIFIMISKEHKSNYLNFITSVPDNYSEDKKYKIMILMHGFGASMYDLLNLAPSINHNDFIYVFPNAPLEMKLGFNQTGYAWFPIESQNYQESSKLLNKTIDEALGMFNSNEIYIGGFSQGGMMAVHAGLFSEKEYQGVIALSAKIIDANDLIIKKNKPENTQLFISHGRFDSIISINDSFYMKKKLEDLGFKISFNEYEMGHEINPQVLNDLSEWITKN